MPIGRVTPNGISLLGTCFLLPKEGWFATASHVCGSDDKNLVIVVPDDQPLSDYQDMSDQQVRTTPDHIVAFDPVRDTAVVAIDQNVSSNLVLGSLDDVNVGREIALFGYPHSDHGRKVLTMQSAEIGAKVMLEAGQAKSKHGVINIQSRPGQSGSPVIDKSSRNVIAILVGSYAPGAGPSGINLGGIDPQTLHQTSHAVSAEYLLEMLK